MEKIKSVLHGHKKDDDVAYDSHNTASTTNQGQQQAPQMVGDHGHSTASGPQSNVQTTSGRPYTDLAQPSGSAGLHGQESQNTHGAPTQLGSDGPMGQPTVSMGNQYAGNDRMHESNRPFDSTSTNTAGGLGTRPDAHPHSHIQDASQASIKSGIIGFGPEDHQEHAAIARHNPTEQSMSPKQVLGAGQPGTAGRMEGSNIPQGYGDQQSNPQVGAIGRDPSSANPAYICEQQPYENTLRQESYTADTNRSFPLAGGVTSRHHDDPTTEHTSSLHNRSLGEREPGTKEKRVGFEDNSPDRDGHGREALAGAAAAATGVAASKTLSQPEQRGVQDQALETRQATYGSQPPAMQTQPGDTGAHDRSLPQVSQTVSAEHSERPRNQRLESRHLHIPGEFPDTPGATPGGESNTFFDYSSVVEPAPPSGQTSVVEPTSTLDPSSGYGSSIEPSFGQGSSTEPSSGQRSSIEPTPASGYPELRHTGTLDEPQPRSSDEHHHGRDAAITGGLGAGAVGLGMHAASQKHDIPDDGSSEPLYEETNPYSSKSIDPRVAGNTSTLGEQRFDPQARTEASPAAQMSDPSSASAVSGPPISRDASDPQHHYGRNAAALGTGAAAAGGLHHALGRNDTPETGNAVLRQDPSYTSGPGSMSGIPDQTSNFSKPLASSGTSTAQQPSGGKDKFYGTPGAPAPIADTSAHHQQPSSTSGPISSFTEVPEREPEHHYGRNAGLAGAAGAATAGGLYAANRHNRADDGSTSNTKDPHPSTALDTQRNVGNHTATGPYQPDTPNRADPRVDETTGQRDDHHYGRNAAAVGGAGAAGYGVYEVAKAYGDHRMTQPAASMEDQRYDPTTSGARAPNPVSQSNEYNYNDPNIAGNVNRTDPDDHVNRNAALGGAGLAAAGLGAGAYAGSRHNDNAQGLPIRQKHGLASSDQPQFSYPMQDPSYPPAQQPYASAQGPNADNHNKRNAALGTAGAAGLGGAAYAYTQRHEDAEAAKRDALMKEKMEKEQQEALKKDVHDRERDQHKLDKEQHKHEKAEEHRLAKEHEKEPEGEEKKKGGLLGFLHRDKSKREKRSSASLDSSPRQSRDYSPRGSMDDNSPESPRWKGKHLLHKEPPKGHPAREAMEHQKEGSRDNIVTDPHTGLPMNSSLGSGAGGTDGNPAIRGQHTHPDSQKVTDWDAVKKGDTPY